MIDSDDDFSADPRDYYFRVDAGKSVDDETLIYITPKSYHDANNCLLDTEIEISERVEDAGLNYYGDSTYTHDDPEQARKICLCFGMTEKPDMKL